MKTRKKFEDLKRKQHRKKDKKPIKKINTFSGRGYIKSTSSEDIPDSGLEKRMVELTKEIEEHLDMTDEALKSSDEILASSNEKIKIGELKEKIKEMSYDLGKIEDFVCGNPDINCGGNCQCGTIDNFDTNKENGDSILENSISDIIDSNNANITSDLRKEKIKNILKISFLISIGYGLSCIVKTIKN